jgi:hypothetical protein
MRSIHLSVQQIICDHPHQPPDSYVFQQEAQALANAILSKPGVFTVSEWENGRKTITGNVYVFTLEEYESLVNDMQQNAYLGRYPKLGGVYG